MAPCPFHTGPAAEPCRRCGHTLAQHYGVATIESAVLNYRGDRYAFTPVDHKKGRP